ncbi:hypothetical protein Q5762_24360 [Streptomyces sp. P9(2023)]|uniref:hypothetical protein n=1 Tax=Streptomyces sp. P9(2023) TaxID=3064394 RepID=UPI0028F428FB|nr:hypothetical protein [Streptomyces sp. P9(2023)]MDT9691420.1 hypothetical protein [Streptomyces sp. P9(2023)]
MTGDPDRPARVRTLGCLYAVIGAILLVVVGLLLASVMVTGFFDRPAEPPKKVVAPTG